jgi:uncharacterized protein (DUF2267 family)
LQPARNVTGQELIDRVRLHSGLDGVSAESALEAVVSSLRTQLGAPEAEALADALPTPLAQVVRLGHYAGPANREVVETQVSFHERVPIERAREHLAAVCRALVTALPPPLVDRLRRATPSLAPLLEDEAPALHRHAAREARTTLSEGHPGSARPLSEAHDDRTQHDSVAAANPHGDRKVSSGAPSLPGRPKLP